MNLNYEYLYQQSDLNKVLNWCSERKFIVLDSETSGIDPYRSKIITLQLGDTEKQWVIDTRSINIEPLRAVIEDKSVIKLGQNLKFDWQMLFVIYKWYMQNCQDTMIAEQVLRCGLHVGASLEALMLRYYNEQLNKDVALRMSFRDTAVNAFSKEQLDYAAGDVVTPLMVSKKQRPEIIQRGLLKVLQLEFAFLPILSRMELMGMSVNVDAWKLLYQDALKKLAVSEKQLDQFFGIKVMQQDNLFGDPDTIRSIKYSSWQQMQKALQRKGYVVPNTNSKTLSLLAIEGQLPKEFVEPLLKNRAYFTRATRYGMNFLEAIDPITNRIHTVFGQTFTNTGRLNSGQKTGEVGDTEEETIPYKVNFQNIPSAAEYRACFVPRPGYCFLIFDYQAIEPRILGDLSKDPTYLEAFLNNKDIYGVVGSKIYGEYVGKETTQGKELRVKTKVVVLGNAYGTGKEKFHKKLLVDFNLDREGKLRDPIKYIDRSESDTLWERFWEICPGIQKTLAQLSDLADPVKSNRKVYDFVAAQEPYEEVRLKCYENLTFMNRNSAAKADSISRRLADNRAYLTYAEALGGRKNFFRVSSKGFWTQARDIPMQGTASTIIKTGMVDVQEAIFKSGHDAFFINQVHDEVIIECRIGQEQEVANYVKPLLEEAGNKYLKVVPTRVEGGTYDHWHKE